LPAHPSSQRQPATIKWWKWIQLIHSTDSHDTKATARACTASTSFNSVTPPFIEKHSK